MELKEKILCDLHAHPIRDVNLEVIISYLSSPGLVGLTVKDIDLSGKDILRYEEALDILPGGSFKEIDKGRLAKIGGGYFARTQEIKVAWHHVLAVGWEGNAYFPNFENIEECVKEIHDKNGIIILNHPFTLIKDQGMGLPKNKHEEEMIRNAYRRVDEVETHNAHNINLLPYGSLAMKKSNRQAEELRKREFPNFKGTSGSDCHRLWSQVKKAGIYLDKLTIEDGTDSIKRAIFNGNFINVGDYETGPYVSRISFVRGILGDMNSNYLHERKSSSN